MNIGDQVWILRTVDAGKSGIVLKINTNAVFLRVGRFDSWYAIWDVSLDPMDVARTSLTL